MGTCTTNEVKLGKEQVLGTIEALYAYQKKVQMMKSWF